jgi:WD40 repeat protein
VLEICFHSKILKVEMNYTHIYLASKDHLFIFALKDMQLIKRIKAPNHLLRISMNPVGGNILAFSDTLDKGKVCFAGSDTWKDIEVSKHFPVQKVKFNHKGDLLAVSCSHANLIHVYTAKQQYCSLQLTGTDPIIDMAFCPNLRFLLCLLRTNETDLLQLFNMETDRVTTKANPQSPGKIVDKESIW